LNNSEFLVVNAFAKQPFGGNPAAVFFNAAGLSDATMQALARQLNLVESVFVLPANNEADFQLRYFTPTAEIPLGGHPSIAAWFALLHEKIVDGRARARYKQINQAGIQEIQIDQADETKPLITMLLPQPRFLDTVSDVNKVASVFAIEAKDIDQNLPIQAVDAGLGQLIVPLVSLDALMRVKRHIEPLQSLCRSLKVREAQLFCFETMEKTSDMHTRNICPRDGLEDPACGTGNGALAAYLAKNRWPEKNEIKLEIEQGNIINMPSIIQTRTDRNADTMKVYVGGTAIAMLRGQVLV
jgi:trans-2,3-dihydro-3-hydroxyanthranilate isomerase